MGGLARSRRLVVWLSRAMSPFIRRGLLPATRFGGAFCVLRTRGRRSGTWREAALDVARAPDGGIWVLACWGEATRWYRNLVADPAVEVILDGRRHAGRAVTVHDPGTRIRAIRAVIAASGVAGRLAGVQPGASDEELEQMFAGMPVVHVRLA